MSIKRCDFQSIQDKLNNKDDINVLKPLYPNISQSTFLGILSQKRSKNYRSKFYTKIHNLKKHYQSFLSGNSTFLDIANQLSVPSYIFCNQLLFYIIENDPMNLFQNKEAEETNDLHRLLSESVAPAAITKKIFKNPQLISNPIIRKNVNQCIYNDDNCSPLLNYIRASTGIEYELLLQDRLFNLNIPFFTENELRKDGYHKTPDIKLQIPFVYKGNIINWVESKASFCDDHNYKNTKDQIIGYKNRYGPGMVIFWFGFIEDLNNLQDQGVCHPFFIKLLLFSKLRVTECK
ncbi:hypothetical protein DLAC_02647 [Tieghemostelium lacteum]|uniref:CDAN1-interacting nuclease 1 n=1 Tax=Tieghemostelium lacteum TaxID=361077 RepID=A0A152A2Y9_TIELA|nr:hypothetical protein DLAC_02647 [Tieghemostelium lacteum]|eukprot:KYR00623.1 hypothetical protein DLAC_02647 [Tieghemostelium lacteum]